MYAPQRCMQLLSESQNKWVSVRKRPGLEVIKLEYSLRLEIKRNDWLLADISLYFCSMDAFPGKAK